MFRYNEFKILIGKTISRLNYLMVHTRRELYIMKTLLFLAKGVETMDLHISSKRWI